MGNCFLAYLDQVLDDYPKLGVWPDGYYFSSQRGYNCCGLDVGVFDRANMLNGNPATFQTFHLNPPTVILLQFDDVVL